MNNKRNKKFTLKDELGNQFEVDAISIFEAEKIAKKQGAKGYLDFMCGEVCGVLP